MVVTPCHSARPVDLEVIAVVSKNYREAQAHDGSNQLPIAFLKRALQHLV